MVQDKRVVETMDIDVSSWITLVLLLFLNVMFQRVIISDHFSANESSSTNSSSTRSLSGMYMHSITAPRHHHSMRSKRQHFSLFQAAQHRLLGGGSDLSMELPMTVEAVMECALLGASTASQ